jgi:TolA-binding protein
MDSIIKNQISKISANQEVLSKQLISQSKYAGMNREQRRELEGYVDSLNILVAQEKDIRKAQILGERVGEVLERVRKQLDSLLTKANDYNFPSTSGGQLEGLDYGTTLDASGNTNLHYDLTTDLVKRESWENAVKTLSETILSYINSQYLGDYSLLHNQVSGSANANVYYRPVFTYLQVVNNTYSTMNSLLPTENPSGNDFVFVIHNPDLEYLEFHNEVLSELQDLEDETGLVNLLRKIQNQLEKVRDAQSQNDKDLTTLESINEVNEQNKLFYTKLIEQVSRIDEEEIKMKLTIGQSLIKDLRHLQKETYDKSSYFTINDVVSKF